MKALIKQDEMTPAERMAAFFSGREYDRLPCCPSHGETCAPLFGVKMCDYYASADKMVKVETGFFRKFRPDAAGIGLGLRGIPDAMGAKIGYPDYGIAYISEPLVRNYADIENLKIIDPYKDGCLPEIIEANKKIRDTIGGEVGVSAGIAGPFTVAAAIRGTENFLRDIYINPSAVHKLLEIVTENCLRYIDAVCSMGFSSGVGDPVASGSVISLKHFREFAKPYIQLCHKRIKKWTGNGGRLHICGRTSQFWNDMVECGASILSIDNIEDMWDARNAVGNKICLMGNIDPVKVIKEGTVKDVFAGVKECIRKAGNSPCGCIISSGCQVPAGSPAENIQAMMDAARIYGQKKLLEDLP
jgi:uroporphyrinogen decarboxylase